MVGGLLAQIHNEDCLKTMSGMADNAVDVIITSPPYNMNLRVRNGQYCSRQVVKEFSTKYVDFPDNLPIEDFYNLHRKILVEMLRVSPLVFYNISVVTGSNRAFFKIMGDFSEYLKDIIIWDKKNAQPAMKEGVLNRRTEMVLVFSDDAMTRQFGTAHFKRGTVDDLWQIPKQTTKDKDHGAVFPEELVRRIVTNFTNKDAVVYDPFMGSGTTGAVCVAEGRRFIGSEISEKYFAAAQKRIINARTLFTEAK